MANTLVYLLDGKIYINLTNRCTNDCIFCLRKDKDDVKGQELWLDDENSTAEDVIKQLSSFEPTKEVIFCGYGEPLLKFEELNKSLNILKRITLIQKFGLTQTDMQILYIKKILYPN